VRAVWRPATPHLPALRPSASPSFGPGNGIFRAETGGGFQAQNAGERPEWPEFGSQTATRLANRPKLRGFLLARKRRRFARTVWWGMQGSNLQPLSCEEVDATKHFNKLQLRLGELGLRRRRKACERGSEDGVGVDRATGRLVELRQRERRLQFEAPRLQGLRDGDSGAFSLRARLPSRHGHGERSFIGPRTRRANDNWARIGDDVAAEPSRLGGQIALGLLADDGVEGRFGEGASGAKTRPSGTTANTLPARRRRQGFVERSS